MRLSLLLQRCLPGRNVRMLRKVEDTIVAVGMEVARGATTTTPKVDVEDMREEEEETGEVEEEAPEGGRCRELGEIKVEEGEAVIIRAIIKMQEVVRGEEGGVVMVEQGTTKAASRTPATMEEEVVTMTITTMMEAGIRTGGWVEEVVEGGEEEVEEAGEVGGGRILTKEDRLSSSFSMVGRTTTKLALINSDTTRAKRQYVSQGRTLRDQL